MSSAALRERLNQPRAGWRARHSPPPQRGRIVLTQRRVYVLPTGQGVMMGITLLLMLVGSINYNLSLGYVLTFLLGSMAVVGILHTWRNLAGLGLRASRPQHGFAGGTVQFSVCLDNPGRLPRLSITLVRRAGGAPARADVAADATECVGICAPAPHRGRLDLGPMTVETRFPLGLFRAWSYVDLYSPAIVFPAPEHDAPALPATGHEQGETTRSGSGEDDFAGLREYRAGDPPRHVAWKAVAQERGMLTKHFSGQAGAQVWIDWEEAGDLDTERRLSRLCAWVLAADDAGSAFGVRLPGVEITPASGAEHRERCLRALALHGLAEGDAP